MALVCWPPLGAFIKPPALRVVHDLCNTVPHSRDMVSTMRVPTDRFDAVPTIGSGKRRLLLKRPLPFSGKVCHLTQHQRAETSAERRVTP